MKWLVPLVLCLGLVAHSRTSEAGKKKKYNTFHLKMKFIVGAEDYWTNKPKVLAFIKEQVKEAEKAFSDKPALKIDYSVIGVRDIGGKPAKFPTFESNKDYKKWMDKHVDNVAKSKTDGYVKVLVVDSLCIKMKKKDRRKQKRSHKCPGGKAWFPHWVTPLARKTGIALVYKNDKHTLAHELGHIFSLKHTFAKYVNVDKKLNCNKDYNPKGDEKGKCRSCQGKRSSSGDSVSCDGKANIMDYCFTDEQYLNSCQLRRAANQRRKYMTRKGKTNYKDLRGIH